MNKRTNHKYISGYYRRNSDAVPHPWNEDTDGSSGFIPNQHSAAMSQRNYFEQMSPLKIKGSAENELK